jgi:hypothetical protein
MRIDRKVVRLSNKLRQKIQRSTVDIDEGESVSILLWWTFIVDHARCHDLDPKALAREQLEAFIDGAADNVQVVAKQ